MSGWIPSRALTTVTRPTPLQAVQVTRNESVRFGYSVGSLNFLIAEGVLSEVLRSPAIYPIPLVTTALRGYLNKQGALIPVWDLASMLDCHDVDGEADRATAMNTRGPRLQSQQNVLVLGRDDNRAGILIDGLPRVIRGTDAPARVPLLPACLHGHVTGASFSDDVLWLELNHISLFESLAVNPLPGQSGFNEIRNPL